MIDCKTIQPQLSPYVDGALSSRLAWDVKLHLSSCAVCARIAGELSATAGLLRALPEQSPSAGFADALARRLADQALRPHRPSLTERLRLFLLGDNWTRPRVPRPALAAAVAGVAALVATSTALRQPFVAGSTTKAAAATAITEEQFLEKCVAEHSLSSAGEPLGEEGAWLAASAAKGAL